MSNVYFAFHYDDVISFRANAIRNLSRFGNLNFNDSSLWEREKTADPERIRAVIDKGLLRTHATCILIGGETYARRWVRYEIMKSLQRGNGIFAVHINRVHDKYGKITKRGRNPLNYLRFIVAEGGGRIFLEELHDRRWTPYPHIPSIKTDHFSWWSRGHRIRLSDRYQTYCFKYDNAADEFDDWVEAAISNSISTNR